VHKAASGLKGAIPPPHPSQAGQLTSELKPAEVEMPVRPWEDPTQYNNMDFLIPCR
jgi:hypothetical protein